MFSKAYYASKKRFEEVIQALFKNNNLNVVVVTRKKRLIEEFSIIVEIKSLLKSFAKHLTNVYFKHKKQLLFNILYGAIE